MTDPNNAPREALLSLEIALRGRTPPFLAKREGEDFKAPPSPFLAQKGVDSKPHNPPPAFSQEGGGFETPPLPPKRRGGVETRPAFVAKRRGGA